MSNVVVWSKKNCPYCVMAKRLLDEKGCVYEERIIGEGWTREDLLEAVPEAKTVPQIFIDGNLIGGYDRLNEWFNGGK